jgi:Replication-relaxation
MTRTRLYRQSSPSRRPRPPGGGVVGAALAEHARLTDRDLALIELLHEHRVLTGDQITRLYFTAAPTARHRLVELTRRDVLARFRRRLEIGSQHWRYTLGPVGATLYAAAHGDPLPRPARVAAQHLALAGSPRLEHLIATNEVFVALAHHARAPSGRSGGDSGTRRSGAGPGDRAALAVWWSERQATAAFGTIVRPDGYGEWVEHNRRVGFFLELDQGTEPLARLVDKLTGYTHLIELGAGHPVLILIPTTIRESHLHQLLRAHPRAGTPGRPPSPGIAPLVVATTAADHLAATGAGPADPVWLRPHHRDRARLIDLAPPASASSPRRRPYPP